MFVTGSGKSAPSPVGETLESGDYFASILHCRDLELPWYYVIQRKGSSAVLAMERFSTASDATEGAIEVLSELHSS